MRHAVVTFALLLGCQSAPNVAPAPAALAQSELLDALDEGSRGAIRRSPVPVLLLPPEHASGAVVTAGRGFYAVSAREGELTLAIHATDVEHDRGDGDVAPPRAHEVRGRPALVLVNDGIRSVTWEEGRTSYVVEVECFRALEDARCTEADFVLALADSLVPVAGEQVTP